VLGTVESPGRLGFFAVSMKVEFAFGVTVDREPITKLMAKYWTP
jgi:hypothetical protein